jgi:hypothetical protein
MDAISITALIVSVIGALGHFVKESHIKECNCFCVDSDCRDEDKNLNNKIDKIVKDIEKKNIVLDKLKRKKSLSNIITTPPNTPISNINELIETSI